MTLEEIVRIRGEELARLTRIRTLVRRMVELRRLGPSTVAARHRAELSEIWRELEQLAKFEAGERPLEEEAE